MNDGQEVQRDLAAIERLHERDRSAMERGDFDTLLTLGTDDRVLLPPGAEILRGVEAMKPGLQAAEAEYDNYESVSVCFDFEEVVVLGDTAYEWGTVSSRVLHKDGTVEREVSKLMRILQRQQGGEWLVHRAIWNDAPIADADAVAAGERPPAGA